MTMNSATVTLSSYTRVAPFQVYYPESDGEPMAETDVHREQMIYLIEALKDHFREREGVYVAGNLFMYYEEGNPQAVVAPDVFVVLGVADKLRRTYKVWHEGRVPDVVFEITSPSTRYADLGNKKGLYAYLRVPEYFLYDPFGDYLHPALQGYTLRAGTYQRLLPHTDGRLFSQQLGVTLHHTGRWLRLYNAATGEKLLTPQEAQSARRAEAAARYTAEARVAELEAELARLYTVSGRTAKTL